MCKMQAFLWIIALVLTVSDLKGCNAVLNGILAPADGFPYQVLLNIFQDRVDNTTSRKVCGGSVISKSWVLTAAHCVAEDSNSTTIKIAVTTETSFSPMSLLLATYTAKTCIVHDEYNSTTLLNDIALLRLRKPFEWSSEVLPIQLYNETEEPRGTAIVAGWGRTKSAYEDIWSPTNLLQTRIALSGDSCGGRTNETAPKTSNAFVFDAELMICTWGLHTGICSGDSGSPLTFQGRQIGIASYSSHPCAPPSFAAFTRVSAYLHWIDKSCQGCLGEPKPVKGYSPEPLRRPTKAQLKYQVLITSTESAAVVPPSLISQLSWICSGSIIADAWVLTSTECFNGTLEGFKLWVLPVTMLGEEPHRWVPVARLYTDEDETHTIALLELEQKFEWSESLRPVELELEPFSTAGTGEMFVFQKNGSTVSEMPSRVVSVDLAAPKDCIQSVSLLLDEFNSDSVLCGLAVNLEGEEILWYPGSPVVLSNGKQIGIAAQGDTSELLMITDQIAGNAEWIQHTCGGCLLYYDGMYNTRKRLNKILSYKWYLMLAVGLLAAIFGVVRKLRSKCQKREENPNNTVV